MTDTLAALLADKTAHARAIGAPVRTWMDYGTLRALSADVAAQLRGFGVGAADRVAIVLPNGPEMAAAFVTIAQAAVTAPLNPAYQREEYAFYLEDLRAKAIVVPDGYDGPALAAAEPLGMVVLRLVADAAGPAGAFRLAGPAGKAAPAGVPGAEATALILHTSGTTSRPKIVPLLQSNLAASARHIGASLALTGDDVCLNVMPLFHIHGLVAAVTASLAAGGAVWCAPGFDALKFFGWMTEAKPTWYTAVPTMHQAILARAARNRDTIAAHPLRFLRSSSASLPAQVMVELQETFNAPVIEAYGMTEAAHQMACNPLPPRAQKPGSVGIAAGPLLRIAHEVENRLVDGTGEVVISGPNVTPGYEGNPEANAKNFFEAEGRRWFRTGDQGALDEEGYLRLTGRLKEIINRGGEKISPLEVDGVLLDHPAVQQVVAFAMPHPKLGEEVAAAVVLREGHSATEREIRDFAASRMADFKVPRRVVILDEIPKGATGKLQRIGLAEKLGLGVPA
ncbi:acyl--CoA ligase [Rhodobacteraceae bacterium HSP-20]|uniref:Acyl--CoA ligase n=1 Tax=Paragemmobacter amnigenus TaxID=2852097 RepID=A0ABS6J9F2_9RHOB|nr:acyl--CoA ligase [Rhodobacter amnigenus]MBU9699102.1 acyl--CoA ligase [Rhodobacter amnigenus]MBV4390329.1 acyl--CoA ligase [Rhodobacter amnigenus]